MPDTRPVTAAECVALHGGLNTRLDALQNALEERIEGNKETVVEQQKGVERQLVTMNGNVQANTAFRLEARGMIRATLFLATIWGAVAAGLVIFLR